MQDIFKTIKRTKATSIKMAIANELSSKDDVIALSVADSDYETSKEIKQALTNRVNHGAFGYLKTPDDYETMIKTWYEERYHVKIEENWILPAPKVLNAMALTLEALTEEQDKVVIQTPVYHMFYPLVKDMNRTLIENPLLNTNEGYKIDFNDLEQAFREGAKTLILCSPHNPVGRVFTKNEIDQIIKLAKKYHVLIISDEIHGDIIMPNHRFISLADYYDNYDNMVIVSAPSKTFNIAGLQIAHLIIKNKTLRDEIKKLYQKYHLAYPNSLALVALEAAYKKSAYWVDLQNKHIMNNYLTLKTRLEHTFDKIKITPLEGTYLAWVDLGFTNKHSKTIILALAEEGVILSAGHTFSKATSQFVRINLATSKEQLSLAIDRIIAGVKRLMGE